MLHASHSTNSATKWWTHWYKTVLACQTSMHIITLSDTVAKMGIMCVYGWLSITSKLLFGVLRIPPNEFCCGYNERCSRQSWHEQSHWRSDGWDASQLCYKAVPGSGLFLKHANVYNEPVIENEMCHLFGIAAPHLAGPTASTLCVLFCSEEQWKQFNTNWGDELDGAIKCECLKNGGNDLIRIMPSMLQKPVASISHIAGPLFQAQGR